MRILLASLIYRVARGVIWLANTTHGKDKDSAHPHYRAVRKGPPGEYDAAIEDGWDCLELYVPHVSREC